MDIKKNANDVKYAQMMIPHHEKAIQDSANEWSNGENEDMRNFALNVFSTQTKEVAWLRAWLQSVGESEKAGGM